MTCFLCADESRSCLLLCARRVHVCAVLVRLLVHICIVLINTSYEENKLKHTDMANCQRQPQFGCWPGACLAVGAVAQDGRLVLPRPNPTPSHRKQHRPPRPDGLFNWNQTGARLPAHAHARGRTQVWPAEPSTRHQPGTRRDAACGASFAQGPAAKTPKATAKPGPCMSTDNLKQDTRKCRAATRQGEDTATRKENKTVCLFQFLCLQTQATLNESRTKGRQEWAFMNGTESTDILHTRKSASRPRRGKTTRMHDEEATLLATSNKSPQQRSLLRTRLKLCLLRLKHLHTQF